MIDQNLPALYWHSHSQPEIEHSRYLGAGDSCVCYLVNQSHVVRIARHDAASAALRRESRLLIELSGRVGVAVPQIEGVGIAVDSGQRFVYYPLVPGAALEAEVLMALDPASRRALVGQMAEAVARLHRTPPDVARACELPEVDPRRALPELIERARGPLSGRLDRAVWAYYERLVAGYLARPELNAYVPAVLHGDLSPDHFLGDVERRALTGLIDFGDCQIGDPCWDLIYVLEDYGPAILDLWLTFDAPAPAAATRVRLFQQLNNVEYCLGRLAEGDAGEIDAAIETLITQATAEAIE
jgi:aminoglycoside 2''-phosphotransferase